LSRGGGRSSWTSWSRTRWWRGTVTTNFHGDLCTIPELLRNATSIRWDNSACRKLIGGRFILFITNRETAVPREIIPLEQDKISCEAIWKLELVTE
jgi:hypothetical protein